MRGSNGNTTPFSEYPWLLVSTGVLEPVPQGYRGTPVLLAVCLCPLASFVPPSVLVPPTCLRLHSGSPEVSEPGFGRPSVHLFTVRLSPTPHPIPRDAIPIPPVMPSLAGGLESTAVPATSLTNICGSGCGAVGPVNSLRSRSWTWTVPPSRRKTSPSLFASWASRGPGGAPACA